MIAFISVAGIYLIGVLLALIIIAKDNALEKKGTFSIDIAAFSWLVVLIGALVWTVNHWFKPFYEYWFKYFGGKI
ncbi:MAG: hypothetical protein J6I84_04550 [Bacilli bacterium]|nr:hypothetical protein [Bacilli bacterium]